MKPNLSLSQLGLPITRGPVRFCVGPPDGLTSNSWRFWATKHGDVYICCRDNFREVKVSLHASGPWRMGFTTEAVGKNPAFLADDENRAWDIWDEPPATLPNTVVAFKLIFPTSELAVRPEQRMTKQWQRVLHVEAAPPGKVTVLTLFVTKGVRSLKYESEPSFCLASLDIGNQRRAQLVAHGDPEGDLPTLIESSVAKARAQAESADISISEGAYAYCFGRQDNGCRFIVGARMNRSSDKA